MLLLDILIFTSSSFQFTDALNHAGTGSISLACSRDSWSGSPCKGEKAMDEILSKREDGDVLQMQRPSDRKEVHSVSSFNS